MHAHTHTYTHAHTHRSHTCVSTCVFLPVSPYCPPEMSLPALTLPHPAELGTHRVPGLLVSCPPLPLPTHSLVPTVGSRNHQARSSVRGPSLAPLLQDVHDSRVILHLAFIPGGPGVSPALTQVSVPPPTTACTLPLGPVISTIPHYYSASTSLHLLAVTQPLSILATH